MHKHEEERDYNGDGATDGGDADGEIMKGKPAKEDIFCDFQFLEGRVAHRPTHDGQIEKSWR